MSVQEVGGVSEPIPGSEAVPALPDPGPNRELGMAAGRDPVFDFPPPTDAEVADLSARVRAELKRRREGFSVSDLGIPDLTAEQLDYLDARASTPIDAEEVKFGLEHIPGAGAGFALDSMLEQQHAIVAVRAGEATPPQQFLYAKALVDAGREETFGAQLQSFGMESATMGLEFAAAAAGGAGLAALGTRLAARGGLALGAKATTKMLVRRATELSLLTAAREAIPRTLGHEGGAWTVASVRRAIPDMNLSDDEAESMAAMFEIQFADVFLGKAFEENSLYRGLAEDLMSSALEKTVGPLIGRFTANGALKAFQAKVYQKLGGKGTTPLNLAAKLRDVTAVNGGINEVGEELVQNMTVEGVFGDKFIDGLPDDWQELMAIMAVGSVPGAAGTAIELMHARRRTRAEAQKEAEVATVVPSGGTVIVPPSEGGDVSTPGEATAETAGVEPGLPTQPGLDATAREARAAEDVVAYNQAATDATGKPVEATLTEPETVGDLDAKRFMERLGLTPTFVALEDVGDAPSGHFVGGNRAVIVAGSPDARQVATHEAVHAWADQRPAREASELLGELQGIDSAFLSRVESWWKSNTLVPDGSPALAVEETIATLGQALSPIIAYLDTPKGASDFARAYTAEPSRLRRTLTAVFDWIASRIPFLNPSARTQAAATLDELRGTLPESAPRLAARILDALDAIEPVAAAAPRAVDASGSRAAATQEAGGSVKVAPVTPEVATVASGSGSETPPSPRTAKSPPRERVPSARIKQTLNPTQATSVPTVGDRVRFFEPRPGGLGGRRAVEGEVLDATGSGDNVRFRLRLDGAKNRTRAERATDERIASLPEVELIETREITDPSSRRAKNAARAEREERAGAEPRFAGPLLESGEDGLAKIGIAAPNKLRISFTDEIALASTWSKFQRSISDEFLSLHRLVKIARGMGAAMSNDPESAVRRFFGKTSDRARRIDEGFVKPMIRLMVKHKMTPKSVGDYVRARTIPESNADFHRQWLELQTFKNLRAKLKAAAGKVGRTDATEKDIRAVERSIRDLKHVDMRIPEGVDAQEYFHEINPLTGKMTTSEARQLVAAREAQPGYREFGRSMDAFNRKTRELMVRDGLLSQAQANAWAARFRHYVPLKTADVDSGAFPGSRGFGVSGNETKRRKGRKSDASNPFVMSIVQAYNFVQRGERNRVGNTLYEFVLENRGILDLGERDVERHEDGTFALSDTEFHLKVKGRDVAISMGSKDLADALRRVGVARIPSALRLYATAQGVWRSLVTTYSPEFLLRNAFKDIQTALLNVSTVADTNAVRGIRKSMSKNYLRSLRAAYQWSRGKDDTTGLGPRMDEYSRAGGFIGTITSSDFDTNMRAIEAQVARGSNTSLPSSAVKGMVAALDFIKDLNQSVETATRFSLYNALRDKGVAIDPSALASRQLTVDFTQRGTWGSVLSMAYVFFSAGVGGTRRMFHELQNSKPARVVASTLVAQGLVASLLNEELSADDEDGLSFYSKMPEYEKKGNLIFFLPGAREPFKIPMPYGYQIFPTIGRLVTEVGRGEKTTGGALQDLLLASLDNFNPLGGSPSFAQFISPTLLDPFVQVGENQNFAGSMIRPPENPFGPEVARHRKGFRSTSDAAIWAARNINSWTGGDNVDPGFLNWGGDDIEHVIEFFGGGALRFSERVLKTSKLMLAGEFEERDIKTLPWIRSLYGSRTEFTDTSNFYGALEDVDRLKLRIKDAREAGEEARVAELERRFGAMIELGLEAGRKGGVRNAVRDLMDRAYKRKGNPDQRLLDEANSRMKQWFVRYLNALQASGG